VPRELGSDRQQKNPEDKASNTAALNSNIEERSFALKFVIRPTDREARKSTHIGEVQKFMTCKFLVNTEGSPEAHKPYVLGDPVETTRRFSNRNWRVV